MHTERARTEGTHVKEKHEHKELTHMELSTEELLDLFGEAWDQRDA